MSLKVFVALAALLISAPAFARGGGDRGGSRDQSSHQPAAGSSEHGSRSSSRGATSSHGARSASHGSARAATAGHHRDGVSSHNRHGSPAPAHTRHYDHCGHRWQATYWDGHAWIPGLWISIGY